MLKEYRYISDQEMMQEAIERDMRNRRRIRDEEEKHRQRRKQRRKRRLLRGIK